MYQSFQHSIQFFKRVLTPIKYVQGPMWFHILFRVFVFAAVFISASTVSKITNLALAKSSLETLIFASIPVFVITIISASLLFVHARYSTSAIIRHTIMKGLFQEVTDRLFLIDDAASIHGGIGKRLTIVQSGVQNWGTFITNFLLDTILHGVFLILGIVYIGWMTAEALPFLFVYMVIVGLLVIGKQRTVIPFQKKRQRLMEESNRLLARMIMEKQTILLTGGVETEKSSFLNTSNEILENTRTIEWKNAPVFWGTRYILDIVRAITIIAIGYSITLGTSTAGDIVAFGLIFTIMDRFFQTILDQYQNLVENHVYIMRLWNFFDSFEDLERLHTGEDFCPKNGTIEFTDVTYTYPNTSEEVISHFSARFPGGKKIALVGKSGAGKSTIIKMIIGLLKPESGDVFVDNQNLSNIKLTSYFPHIGYLSQEPSVFDGTIRENMICGMVDTPSDETLLTALSHAKCDFIDRLPGRLDTLVGEKGIRLSGGERQRLVIARVFLRNPEILILDEPTSALDSFSEAAITEALHELFRGKTVIIVAHRLQTVKEADSILVLGPKGVVLEQGTHEELLQKGGEYAQMVELQSGF